MGNVCSTDSQEKRLAKAKSKQIDQTLEKESKGAKNECKILLLGAGESGKSTIVKQMKIIHQNGFTDAELLEYRPIIIKNVLDSAKAIVNAMKLLKSEGVMIDWVDGSNQACADEIDALEVSVSGARCSVDDQLEDVAEAIHKIWNDPIIPRLIGEHGVSFYLMDNASHFLSEVVRIGAPDYLPTVTDVLCARIKSTQIKETRFTLSNLSIHMFDVGGQRSERRKWIHCFGGVTSIIFCTALSEYDQVLLEDGEQNRMKESLKLFESVVKSQWFLRTSIILFLNKADVFRKKLPKVPLGRYFPEYIGGDDIRKGVKFIWWKYMQTTTERRHTIFPHVTQATDTTTIEKVFLAVKETILQNSLHQSGIL